MTREDQIVATAKEYYEKPNLSMRVGFIEGAKWADANPQLSKEEFIEKACYWLIENFYNHPHKQYLICSEAFDCIEEMVEQFMKAMEE